AIVGQTGAGKSTLVNLICRFFEPTEGKILIDGVDYKERSLLWLESNLSYVLQSPHLFSGTIEENIKYSNPNATHEQVVVAAQRAQAHSFIEKLEKGYETDVGQGGDKLSTGQKQLISIARALLADGKILVMDEATSSVDTQTEQLINGITNKILADRTGFIIAHRLSTVKNADIIIVVDEGKIIEMGSHRQLLQNKGHYYNLYTSQWEEQEQAEYFKKIQA
ncbi:MAG: ATP-binding cassette domain-containing protein, partial [Oscillospiraceae bacterium]